MAQLAPPLLLPERQFGTCAAGARMKGISGRGVGKTEVGKFPSERKEEWDAIWTFFL